MLTRPPPQSEKKFYLDQAKKLKDNFNSKYPDYVYRRRPNNSRKKRKPEPNHDDPDAPAHLGDPDDPAYDDASPVDPDDPLGMVPSPQDVQYTRQHHPLNPSPPAPGAYHGHGHGHGHDASAAACTYPYSSDFHSAQHHLASARLPHLDHALGSAGNIGPIRTSSLDTLSQGYHHHQPPPPSLYQNTAHQPSSLYAAHQHAHGGGGGAHSPAGLWDASRPGTRTDGAAPRSNWPVLPALDINLARQRAVPSGLAHGHGHGKADAYSPQQLPARPWSSATSSSGSSAGAGTPHHHYASGSSTGTGTNAFPTLTSAFFPNESPATKAMDLGSPGSGAGGGAHEYFAGAGAGAGAGRRQSAEHAGYAGYGSSWSQQQQQQQQHQQQQHQQQQQQQQQQYGRSAGPYSLQGSPDSTSRSATSASASSAHMGYWSDNRFGR